MKLQYFIPVVLIGIALWVGGPVQHAYAYDTQEYKKINSSMSCRCGCELLVSVCTMEGCMCEGVREQVGQLLDEGRSEDEIIQAMVSTYGEQILAAPPKSGFNLSAYVLPFLFLIVGGVVLYSVVKRWVPVMDVSTDTTDDATSGKNYTSDSGLRHRSRIEDELENLDI